MKIILLTDIPKLGQKNDVCDVSSGYARNALIPQGKARQATPEALRLLEQKRSARKAQKEATKSEQKDALSRLSGQTITTKQKTNEKGHLFAGLDNKAVAGIAHENGYSGITPENINLEAPIKETGAHTIQISADGESAEFTLEVAAKQ